MVDALTLTIAATLVQTAVITLTLIVFIFQFRSQEKATKEASYQNLMGRYNDYVMLQVTTPALSGLLYQRVRSVTKKEPTQEEAAIIGNLLIAYGIIEEAHGLYKKRWIDEETWGQWAEWLKSMATVPQFARLHEATKGTFDPEFQKFVDKVIAETRA